MLDVWMNRGIGASLDLRYLSSGIDIESLRCSSNRIEGEFV